MTNSFFLVDDFETGSVNPLYIGSPNNSGSFFVSPQTPLIGTYSLTTGSAWIGTSIIYRTDSGALVFPRSDLINPVFVMTESIIEGTTNNSLYSLFGVQDGNNFYEAYLSDDKGATITLYKVVGGVSTVIAGGIKPASLVMGLDTSKVHWDTNGSIIFYIISGTDYNGTPLGSVVAVDTTFTSGGYGIKQTLIQIGSSHSQYDNIYIYGPGGGTQVGGVVTSIFHYSDGLNWVVYQG